MINEVVFADKGKIDTKKKTIGLTYTKGNRANNNANANDKLGTEEMDQNNANTIEIPLKGGLISYNITDIKGVDIMHYFKKKWAQRQRATMDVVDNEGNKDTYDLQMDNSEERRFIDRFVEKVEFVIKAWLRKNKKEDLPVSKIAILPVHSTSRFNQTFVKYELTKLNINGLPCEMIDPDLIIKDLKDIQRDEEFISRNKKFYNGDYAMGKPEMGTVSQQVDDAIIKNRELQKVNEYIEQINEEARKLINFLNNNKNNENLTPKRIESLTTHYANYVDLIRKCYSITYTLATDGKEHKFNHEQILNAIKYSKGPSIDNRSALLWQMVKPYLWGKRSTVNDMRYGEMPLCYWKKADFEIKTLRNSVRLGLKNIYKVNDRMDIQKREEEIKKMRGTILLIFDDNISGGATLSDVCLQCKKLGAENIIPITFGKMAESNTMRGIMLNTPQDGYNFSTDNNLSIYDGPGKEKRRYVKRSDRLSAGKEQFDKVFKIDSNLPTLNILWLDDIREPYSYFSVKRQSGAWARNYEYYTRNIFNNYNPNFIWVKNLDEFKKYITTNGMPDMVSLDHDIRPKNYYGQHENGADVAQWLVNYCRANNLKLPLSVAHSANREGAKHINDILASYQGNMQENRQIIKITENELKALIKESIISCIKNMK